MKTLKQLRKGKNLTQKELFKITGIHHTIISKFEKGHQKPNEEQRSILEGYFGESFEYVSDFEIEREARLAAEARAIAAEERAAETEKRCKDLWSMYFEAAEKLRKVEQISKGY